MQRHADARWRRPRTAHPWLGDLQPNAFHVLHRRDALDQSVDLRQVQIAAKRPTGARWTAGKWIEERVQLRFGAPLHLLRKRGTAVQTDAKFGLDGHPDH